MDELIKVDFSGEKPAVSARELHEFLEVGTHFKDWFPRMCEYGFSENEDYTPLIFEHPQNHQPTKDFALSIDMAKEICMIQRNEKGKLARQYFLALEKDWNSPEKVMARALRIADKRIQSLEVEKKALAAENEAMQPKALFADSVAASKNSILIGELAKLLKQNGVEMGQNRLFHWMRSHGYLIRRHGTDYNMPTQKAMEQGLFEIKETAISHSDGHTSVNKTPKVTGKGQQYFVNAFLSKS